MKQLKKLLFLIILLTVSCSFPNGGMDTKSIENGEERTVDINHTDVERQSIGNCWLYAAASWAESLNKTATNTEFDSSQSYWTYMHWFDQIAGSRSISEITTGGYWSKATSIISRYGIIREEDFIPEDGLNNTEISYRQSSALSTLNRELMENGRLSTYEARTNYSLVREIMDEAWGLDEKVISQLDRVFGEDMSKTFSSYNNQADSGNSSIINPEDFIVEYNNRRTTLAVAADEWQSVSYGYYYDKRETLKRVLTALNDGEPVVISWFVDFNALEDGSNYPELEGSFNMRTLEKLGKPGNQGGHMTILEDYEAIVSMESSTGSEPQKEVKNGSLSTGEWAYFPVFNYTGRVDINMTGTGDIDFYAKNGEQPSEDVYDARPYKSGSFESASINAEGALYVGVNGYKSGEYEIEITYYPEGSDPITERITLNAGVTLDPAIPGDKAKLDAALQDDTEIVFLRIKNSWGANRPGLAFAPFSEKGYHDLYMDYLDGSVRLKDSQGSRTPLNEFILPPGY